MKYVSTRGTAPVLGFDDVLLTGLASDAGLYVPETFPRLADGPAEPYSDVALEVMWPYVEGSSIDRDDLAAMIDEAYAAFDTPDVTPLVDLGGGQHLLELFHGPTLAFKDVALQLVGRLFEHVLNQRGERLTIVVATSGDTGSAAIEACRGRAALDIVVLFPDGRVSEVQRRQMTAVDAPNVHCVAIDGTFDDCQDLVKGLFNDAEFRAGHRLSAMNSINWARILPQAVYYVTTLRRLGTPQTFAVPTGNFGNVLAGDIARRMGAPVERLVVASNANDILYRWLQSGVMEIEDVVHATTSPSMDIQISSNAERLLFELYDRNGPALAEHMVDFRATGRLDIGPVRLARLRDDFEGGRIDDTAAADVIRRTYERTGVLVDPHTAVGLGALGDRPGVALATAAPAKFPDAVEAAVGVRPGLPPHLADLYDRPERYDRAPNDIVAVADLVAAVAT